MKEVIEFLTQSPTLYLATVGQDGKPKNRPFGFMMEKGGRLYFCTANIKPVFKELQNNPYVELCACSPDFCWIRLSGRAVFSDDIAIKNEILEKSPMVKKLYGTGDNPIFEIFYLEDAKAVIADFSGNPPKEYTL